MKILLFLITVVILFLALFLFAFKPIIASAKVLLLVTQEFPQIPFKPLHNITPKPQNEKVEFGEQKLIGDLFIPKGAERKPAIIVAMGVKTSDKDRKILLNFCETLSRLGFVVLWPRSEELENDAIKFEDPQTFIEAYNLLEQRKEVDKNRISYVGFSVGSSLSLVAAENKAINKKVRSIVFFGGYYNLFDYFSSLYTKKVSLDEKTIEWEPDGSAVDHAQEILKDAGLTLKQISENDNLDSELTKKLLRFSPGHSLDTLKAKIFILHEKSDSFVPYTESIKLKQVLEENGKSYDYHLANLFEHVQPKKPLSFETGKEILELFGFLHKVFMYL